MMNDHAKFTGELAKGIKIGESSVEVKLLIPLKAAIPHLLFLSSNQGEEINVFLGDPQAAFDFDDEEDAVFKPVPGHRVTTDASGIVTSVEKHGDPNQGELSFQEGENTGVSTEEVNFEGEGIPAEGEEVDEDDDSSGEGGVAAGEEFVEAEDEESGSAEDGQSYETSGKRVEDSGADGQEEGPGDVEPAVEVDVSKEALDEFILKERPIFPEIEYQGEPIPFPDLLDKRLREDKTWREIANERDMTSGQLSSKWSAYRKLAAKKMNGDGGAA